MITQIEEYILEEELISPLDISGGILMFSKSVCLHNRKALALAHQGQRLLFWLSNLLEQQYISTRSLVGLLHAFALRKNWFPTNQGKLA